jgi:hypothetical protein
MAMSETGATVVERTLAFSAVAEAGTGRALMIDPALVVALLLIRAGRAGQRTMGASR